MLVMVNPQDIVNIAAAVRIARNFGIERMRLVNPETFDPWRIEGIAHNSAEFVARIEILDSLEAADMVVEGPGSVVVWHGAPARIDAPGGCAEVVVDVFAEEEDGETWRRAQSRQRHRHHPLELIVALVEEAGLEVVALRGQRPGGVLDAHVDEDTQHKVVVVAGRG
jgi:hypothetical protein